MARVLVNDNVAFVRKLGLPHGTLCSEGKLYLMSMGSSKHILKPLPKNPIYEQAKRYIIDSLMRLNNKDLIPEFIYPENYVDIGWKTKYFSLPYHPSITLKKLLTDPNVSEDVKIEYLKKVGDVLHRTKQLRKTILGQDFAINDLHADNILIGKCDKKLRFCDLDTCKIAGSEVFPSLFLIYYYNFLNKHPEKYSTINSIGVSRIYPNENTDIFCYIMIIVTLLYSNCDFYYLGKKKYNDFLEYLSNMGIPLELLTIFERVYSDYDNINPLEYLDMLKGYINNPEVREFRFKH